MLCSQGNYLAYSARALLIFIFACSILACAPQRKPLPPGEIPKPTIVNPQDEQFGHEILGELSQEYQLDYNHPRRNEVDVAVNKITSAIGASAQPWHVNVFADASVKNAAATKGNHIFIWTGMIDATQNEDELAGVLAHEIGHVLLKHTEPSDGDEFREVMIQIGAFAIGTAASIAVGGAGARMAGQIASSATKQVGEGLFVNPYNREKELEADIVGLYLVKKAGYDPQAVINFWRRALNDPAFSASIPFLSTHPPAEERLVKLEAELRRIENTPITIGKDPSAQFPPFGKDPTTPSLPPQNIPTTPNLPPSPSLPRPDLNKPELRPKGPEQAEKILLPGIKSEGPLPPGDSFDVGPDIMKPQ